MNIRNRFLALKNKTKIIPDHKKGKVPVKAVNMAYLHFCEENYEREKQELSPLPEPTGLRPILWVRKEDVEKYTVKGLLKEVEEWEKMNEKRKHIND
jgi:hypothetical protein